MINNKTYKLVLSAVFCALVFAMTYISIPTPPIGNINLGDCMIIICACVLGGAYSVLAGALGATLCDIASGYVIYAPATFIIKAVMVIIILFARKKILMSKSFIPLILSGIFAELFMIIGYFFYEAIFLSYGFGAIANTPFNAIQGVINIVVSILIFALLKRINLIKND